MKEEIVIPHTSTAPPPVGEDRVKIAELEDIAQIAFRGTKSLNRIQSVVFDAAYYSNENLLISAPTGAGKTNIAMLTVLHEIKNNIGEDGVIKKDNFKVRTCVPCPREPCTPCPHLPCPHGPCPITLTPWTPHGL
jgi:activating signal cointegrator complex subunit 3